MWLLFKGNTSTGSLFTFFDFVKIMSREEISKNIPLKASSTVIVKIKNHPHRSFNQRCLIF